MSRDRRWLAEQIRIAKAGFEALPEWAKRAARFEGGDPRRFVATGNKATAAPPGRRNTRSGSG